MLTANFEGDTRPTYPGLVVIATEDSALAILTLELNGYHHRVKRLFSHDQFQQYIQRLMDKNRLSYWDNVIELVHKELVCVYGNAMVAPPYSLNCHVKFYGPEKFLRDFG